MSALFVLVAHFASGRPCIRRMVNAPSLLHRWPR